MTSTPNISDLFPIPSGPPIASTLVPKPWPGVSPASTRTLREVLEDNHVRWHIYFNDRQFHNHAAHRALAIWALGAPADVIKAGYDPDRDHLWSAKISSKEINENNFIQHLGDGGDYSAYLAFFTEKIRRDGVGATIEKYIFAKELNQDDQGGGRNPGMLGRFLGSLIHPMIHVGHGLEFGLPGMVAQGLALAAVTSDGNSAGISKLFFGTPTDQGPAPGVHAFTVLSRVAEDPTLAITEDQGLYPTVVGRHAAALAQHMRDWHVNPGDVEQKIEELSWVNAILYGVGGWKQDKFFSADFMLMHLVTSTIFLPSYVPFLTPSARELLLRGYLLASLTWWVTRGRPDINIKGFYEHTSTNPTPSGPLPAPHKHALLSDRPDISGSPNPWLPIIETSMVHPDDHLPKIQRTLAHWGRVYGAREAGFFDIKSTGLKDAEKLDGTLFIRVAGLTAEKMGRVREGEKANPWNREGFYRAKSKL